MKPIITITIIVAFVAGQAYAADKGPKCEDVKTRLREAPTYLEVNVPLIYVTRLPRPANAHLSPELQMDDWRIQLEGYGLQPIGHGELSCDADGRVEGNAF